MPELDGETEVVEPAISEPLVNADGELREDWRDALPEDIRGEKVFDRVKNFEGVMKSLASAERLVGRGKVVVPNEASSDVEWDAFYAAGGRPETAADYDLKRPEDFPEEYYNEDLAKSAQELFHKIGLSQKQAQALFEFNNNNALAALQAQDEALKLSRAELKAGLIRDWGNAYEQRKHLGNVAIEQGTGGDEDFKHRLTAKFGDDPDFIRYSAELGSKFAEHGVVDTSKLVPTTADLQAQIDEAMLQPSYSADYAKHGFTRQQHKAQVEKVSRLFKIKTESVKTG